MSKYTVDDSLYDFFSDKKEEETGNIQNKIKEISDLFGIPYSPEQAEVVTWDKENPLVVCSCAGSGKTTTIISNILYKQVIKKVRPSSILCITFTRDASKDMKARYMSMASNMKGYKKPNYTPYFGTFHSFFKGLLESYINNNRRYDVCDFSKYSNKLSSLVRNFSDREQKDILKDMMTLRGEQLNTLNSPDGYTNVVIDEAEVGFKESNYVAIIKKYEELKKKDNVIDYEDMQLMLYNLLLKDDELSNQLKIDFSRRYNHIYIDEYQDINPLQKEIMELLMDGNTRNLIVIGDEDQSIYSFRGSKAEYILNFAYSYVGAESKTLSTNYRSRENILRPVISSIIRNNNRVDKEMLAFKEGGEVNVVTGKGVSNYSALADKIKQELSAWDVDEYPYYAVEVRNNAQRTLIADALIEKNIQVNIQNINYSLRKALVYRNIMEIIEMVENKDNIIFQDYSKRIFKHIRKDIVERYTEMAEINWYDDVIVKNLYNTNNSLINLMKELDNAKTIKQKVNLAWTIMYPHYKNLKEKGFLNLDRVKETYQYMLTLTGNFSTKDFIEIENKKERMLKACINGEYGVNIITFHGSKGLEFDSSALIGLNNSIIPDANRMNRYVSKGQVAEAEKLFEEERRLFYVAWTRPENQLLIEYDINDPSIFLSELKGLELPNVTYKEETSLRDILTPENKLIFDTHNNIDSSYEMQQAWNRDKKELGIDY